ncbi:MULTISPECIES: energy transducer TonB [Lysobacter]|uniref:energy transducer TonB n=1 Tax=Lysobacter TaxID=68 RepID=UPI001F4245D5|nr:MULTISPECIES: energy transducer TonB [Lysobacter]UJB20763.1 energy transducer TonB [Lysobacter capsici]UJQ30123.1 energy transducer TonB [Lysobacter gummosus]
MVRAIPFHHTRQPLDGTRIAANAGAILFNGAMLLLMLAPLSAPSLIMPKTDDPTEFIPIPRKAPPVIITHDPPPKDEPVKITHAPTPRTQTVQPQPEMIVENTTPSDIDTRVAVATPTIETPPSNVGNEVLTGATLQSLKNPPPSYPPDAVRGNLTGVVELEILVGIDGKPIDVSIVRSSGYRILDQAAVRVVKSRWTFQPAMSNGQPVQARGRVPIEFKLDQ